MLLSSAAAGGTAGGAAGGTAAGQEGWPLRAGEAEQKDLPRACVGWPLAAAAARARGCLLGSWRVAA